MNSTPKKISYNTTRVMVRSFKMSRYARDKHGKNLEIHERARERLNGNK